MITFTAVEESEMTRVIIYSDKGNDYTLSDTIEMTNPRNFPRVNPGKIVVIETAANSKPVPEWLPIMMTFHYGSAILDGNQLDCFSCR